MRKIELLAPAGSIDSLVAAVENGADAVYLGGTQFNARQNAGNFNEIEMQRAIEYCHIKGVKVFVTLNILLKDTELKEILDYVINLYNMGADALIIQDMGVGKFIKEILPGFELHASTQMTAHNLDAANLLYDLGYKRIVLSRELSIKEIEHISKSTKAEIEVFCHGAMCICYSGQCLMSSMIGGRSGNRGRCAQPCRQRYTLNSEGSRTFEGYVLSPKDLSTIENIDLLIKAGVNSLKVEGRMKRPEYVAAVISAYRRAIDSYYEKGKVDVPEEDKKNLLKVFNRGGFTTGHMFGKAHGEMMSMERPKNWGVFIGNISNINKKAGRVEIFLKDDLSLGDGIEIWTDHGENLGYTVSSMFVNGKPAKKALKGQRVLVDYKGGQKGDKVYKTLDIELEKEMEYTYTSKDPLKKIPVNCSMSIIKNRPAEIHIYDNDGNHILLEGPVPETALKVPLSEERVREQLLKMGGTPFKIEHIDIKLGDNITLPISAINSMRRDAVDMLIKQRIQKYKPEKISIEEVKDKAQEILSPKYRDQNRNIRLSAGLKDASLVDSAINAGADIIVFGGDRLRAFDFNYKESIRKCRDMGIEVYVSSPKIMRNEFENIAEQLSKLVEYGADGVYVQNLGMLKYVLDKKIPFASGFALNIFNSVFARDLSNMGSSFISLSPELSLKDIKHVAPYVENCEALCYGRIEMMVSEYCPIGGISGCGKEKSCEVPCNSQTQSIIDRMGMRFPIKTDIYCRSHIYNSKILSMMENVKDMIDSGITVLRADFLDENQDEVFKIIEALKEIINCAQTGINQLSPKTNEIIKNIKESGYTKGHFFRGVE